MESPILPPDDRTYQGIQEHKVDVLIVGAGLAGLRAAVDLHQAGFSVVVLEGSDGIGTKVRTVPAADSNPRAWHHFDTSCIGDVGSHGIYKLPEDYGSQTSVGDRSMTPTPARSVSSVWRWQPLILGCTGE
jgi:predicted NAD/FAD-binding protein